VKPAQVTSKKSAEIQFLISLLQKEKMDSSKGANLAIASLVGNESPKLVSRILA